jgi:hypothetical protein
MASRHLQGCSHRLSQLRTVRLTPMSKYWTYQSHAGDMNPVNLVVGHHQKLGLRPLLHWLVRERSWVRTHRSVSRCAMDYVGSPFSWEQWDLSKSIGASWKVATYEAAHRKRTLGVRGLVWKAYVSCCRVFPCRVYIDSNHRDSQIWVTTCLWQSSRS